MTTKKERLESLSKSIRSHLTGEMSKIDFQPLVENAIDDVFQVDHNQWLEHEYNQAPHLDVTGKGIVITLVSNWEGIEDVIKPLSELLDEFIEEAKEQTDDEIDAEFYKHMAEDFRKLAERVESVSGEIADTV